MGRRLGCGSIAIVSLMVSACGGAPLDRPATATPVLSPTPHVAPAARPADPSAPVAARHFSTATLSIPATATLADHAAQIIVHGKVYDAAYGLDKRLTKAVIEWQFTALDWQAYNGRLSVPDGIYQLPLVVRPDDELIIIASAPGYLPSATQVQASQLGEFGTRLNFGLIHANGPAPTVPGSLGAVQVSGIVYNVARGLTAPIEQAAITIVKNSVVDPAAHIDLLSTASGTFSVTLELHATDQVQLTIVASGYLTTTLARTGKDLARNPRLNIGLRPAPQK